MLKINQIGKKKYPFLFSPLKVGNLTIPNRIFFPPWDFNWANKDGSVSQKLHDYYVSLAENGCGIVYTGAATVSPDSFLYEYSMAIHNKCHIPSNKKLCKAIEARGAIPAIQLMNFGRQAVTTYSGTPILAPSNIPCPVTSRLDPNYRIKEMTVEDIKRVENDYINAAVLAAEAGYKIIQVHAAHGYLLCNFMSPYTNKRTDEYGGSAENRCRIVVEVIEGIRKKLGNSVVIDVRLTVDELVDGGLVPEDYAVFTPLIERAGVDMMSASLSNFESAVIYFPTKLEPEARYVYSAETLKKYTSLPIAHAAFIGSLEKGEELLRTQKTDLVGYGRMQFADQAFVKKSVMGQKVNKCVWCGKCLADLMDPTQKFMVHCTVNKKYKRRPSPGQNGSV
ncbi:MAG: NADH:flavin oxidoreductase [Firmicutes bacterium]|nr:NADH:flavin oxidoreductase [Bacillota bacterium]